MDAAPDPGDWRLAEGDVNTSPERRSWQARALDRDAQALVAEDARLFMSQSLSSPCLAAVAKAEGIWLEDTAGRRYMDFHGNNVHHIGYGHPRLVAAVKRQIDALPFSPRRFANPVATALARKLTSIAPDGLDKALFTTGGSDAIDVAIKYARAFTGRHKTLSFWDAFHGAGFGGASVGGEAIFRSGKIGPLLPGTSHVAPFACYRCPYGYPVDADGAPDLALCRMACANMVKYVLEKEGDVAAVIAEPIRAVPYVPPPDFWRQVRAACHAHGALLIFDEIPLGLGKTGRMFVAEHFGVAPDILVLGKALGGGMLPIAAMLARADLDVAGTQAFGHYTHEKNPVTAAAALATIEIIEDEGLVDNAAAMGAYAQEILNDMKTRRRLIGDIRGKGLAIGIELVRDRDAKTPANEAADRVLYRALTRGLNFKLTMGNVIALSPPLTVNRDEIARALGILDQCLAEEERHPARGD
ncbi:MAG: aspartate aminotransferase family protein [Alphaproteobacteria bacterium]|nr:aspartate aminotransferase family protein [Alphaproteobacteria bacterium]